MRIYCLYILLLAYSAAVVRPALPAINDLAAHLFWKYEHLKKVHIENGQFHVHYESISTASNTSSPDKSITLSKWQQETVEHPIVLVVFTFNLPSLLLSYSPQPSAAIVSPSVFIDVPPPRLFSQSTQAAFLTNITS